jgi:hypothetical protein
MSKKLLKKLSSIITNPAETTPAVTPVSEDGLNAVLEDHLDIIAAAHVSTHASHHNSQIN